MMKSRTRETKAAASHEKDRKPRFRIEKLEERIAPKVHLNPHGKLVGCGKCVVAEGPF